MRNKGILVVSFGTSYKETRQKTIGAIEESIQKAFCDYKIYRAFTSTMIKRKLQKEGIIVYNVKEAMEQILADGITEEVIVQPTHMINGIEYDLMCKAIEPFKEHFRKILFGTPLLTSQEDYKELADIIKNTYPVKQDEALVLMGHGSDHYANAAYPAFEYVLKAQGYDNILVGTVEGYPAFSEVKKQLERKHMKKVCLAPMMIVAGEHASHDMVGDEDSWKTELEQDGYQVRYHMKGLGELADVQQMFIRHTREVMNS